MKRIGLIGGMSWESTATYYRMINEAVRDNRGGLVSADIVFDRRSLVQWLFDPIYAVAGRS